MQPDALSLLLLTAAAICSQARAGSSGGSSSGSVAGMASSRSGGEVAGGAAAVGIIGSGTVNRFGDGGYYSNANANPDSSYDNRYRGPPQGALNCNVLATGAINATEMQGCNRRYRTGKDGWSGQVCGGLGWFKGGNAYENADNCFDACQACLLGAIARNATSVQCDNKITEVSKCWMGWH
ncbi:MAG: hypothetical protein M1832_002215 [Thelocarpon impressellum]|nr:MAG: hypothetical protein M1832_002215 [Thelocarpon impressellum]